MFGILYHYLVVVNIIHKCSCMYNLFIVQLSATSMFYQWLPWTELVILITSKLGSNTTMAHRVLESAWESAPQTEISSIPVFFVLLRETAEVVLIVAVTFSCLSGNSRRCFGHHFDLLIGGIFIAVFVTIENNESRTMHSIVHQILRKYLKAPWCSFLK